MTSGETPARDDFESDRTVPTLGYANTGRRSYRRAAKVGAIVLAGLGIVFAARWAAPRVITRLNVLRQQKALMSLNRPAQTAVWDEDPAAVAAAQGAPRGPGGGGYAVQTVRAYPKNLSVAYLTNTYRLDFDAAVGGLPGEFTAFAGPRSAPGGRPRLVVVGGMMATWSDRAWNGSIHVVVNTGRTLQLSAAVIEPGSFASPTKAVGKPAPALGIELRPDDRLRLYAGQPDHADPSRFTIDYDCNGVRGTVDGVLNTDDTVSLRLRGPIPRSPGAERGIFLPAGTKHIAERRGARH